MDDIKIGHFDFVLYYSAAKIIDDGKRDQLYDLALQKDYQKGFGLAYRNRVLPYNHPPYELLALLPLANFSFPVAHALWTVINILLLVLMLYRLSYFVTAEFRALFGLMLFAYYPTLTALKMGQDSIITAYLLVETFVNLKRRRFAVAGAVLALGLYKPQFVLPLAGILFFRRCWPAVLGFLSATALLAAVSLAMVGSSGLAALFSMWLSMTHRGQVVWPELMVNLRGLVYMILNLGGMAGATNVLNLLLSALVYVVALRLWRVPANDRDELFNLRFALAVTATVLVSFHLYSYDATLLILPMVLMLDHVLKGRARSTVVRPALFALLIFLFLPLLPNWLLSVAVLAWWALPIPILFGLIAVELVKHVNSAAKPLGTEAIAAVI
ncbi:MAG: glycosyltransferase family 87 protein [Chloroflexota bacterium]